MTPQGVIADAEGDIAALVYSSGDRPDLVLCAFAEHLASAGKRLCGLVQFRDALRDGSPAGRGFRDAILAASETQTPLIIAVPEFEFERWTHFSRGMTVRLECTLDSVLGWWRRVSSTNPSDRLPRAQACELFK